MLERPMYVDTDAKTIHRNEAVRIWYEWWRGDRPHTTPPLPLRLHIEAKLTQYFHRARTRVRVPVLWHHQCVMWCHLHLLHFIHVGMSCGYGSPFWSWSRNITPFSSHSTLSCFSSQSTNTAHTCHNIHLISFYLHVSCYLLSSYQSSSCLLKCSLPQWNHNKSMFSPILYSALVCVPCLLLAARTFDATPGVFHSLNTMFQTSKFPLDRIQRHMGCVDELSSLINW